MDSAGGEVKFAGAKLRALRVREIDAAKLEASELPSRDAAMRNWPAQRAELQLDPWGVLVLPELGVRASASTSRVDGGSWRMG
jgi:hypothetical protein